MKFPKATLNYVIITYICAFLVAGSFIGSLSAKVIPKRTMEEVGVITIKKGDTLWDLAVKYFQDPFQWKNFKKYNNFTNPNLIYPGEKLMLPVAVARQMQGEITSTMGATQADLDKITKKYDKAISKFQATSEEVTGMKKLLSKLRAENQARKEQLRNLTGQMRQQTEQMKQQGAQGEKAREQMKRLESLLTSQKAASQLAKEKIDKLEESIAGSSKQMEAREAELSLLSKEMREHTKSLLKSQESISELQKKLKEAEYDYAAEAEKPSDSKESKLAVATAIAGGIALFVVGVLAR